MKHAAMFNGIGGFQLAAEWMDWENYMSCEIDPFCNKVTKHHFPNCIQHEDIRTTDFTIYRGIINILTGGFPCQDISVASSNGKKGLTGESSGLWFEMLRAIREIWPNWVVTENVYGLINQNGGMALETIIAGMESEGYEVFSPIIIPAAATGANHIRKRVWIVANSISQRDRIPTRKIQAGRNISEHCSWWDSEPEICRIYDGLPEGLDKRRLKALGNAVVPQIPYTIFKAIEQYNALAMAEDTG